MGMLIARRGLLTGLVSALAAPALIRTPGLLMPVRQIVSTPIVTPSLVREGLLQSYSDAISTGLWCVVYEGKCIQFYSLAKLRSVRDRLLVRSDLLTATEAA